MSGPLEFAARLLARRGALVEATQGSVEALVSASLASEPEVIGSRRPGRE